LFNFSSGLPCFSWFLIIIACSGLSTMAHSTSMSCPTQFHELPLAPSAGFCQVFDQELPASMSYFANLNQAAVKDFYLEALGTPNQDVMEKGRNLLNYQDRQLTIVISPDGIGSQIDILLKDK
jgi:hypothetical protein